MFAALSAKGFFFGIQKPGTTSLQIVAPLPETEAKRRVLELQILRLVSPLGIRNARRIQWPQCPLSVPLVLTRQIPWEYETDLWAGEWWTGQGIRSDPYWNIMSQISSKRPATGFLEYQNIGDGHTGLTDGTGRGRCDLFVAWLPLLFFFFSVPTLQYLDMLRILFFLEFSVYVQVNCPIHIVVLEYVLILKRRELSRVFNIFNNKNLSGRLNGF
jgi:hypothetical protein